MGWQHGECINSHGVEFQQCLWMEEGQTKREDHGNCNQWRKCEEWSKMVPSSPWYDKGKRWCLCFPSVRHVFDRKGCKRSKWNIHEAKVIALSCPVTVLEAETIGVREALSWVIQRGDDSVIVETNSLLTVRALQSNKSYMLEVGHMIEHYKWLLQSAPGLVVTHVHKQVNKVAHSLVRIPCSINCFHVCTAPSSQLLETVKNDFSNEWRSTLVSIKKHKLYYKYFILWLNLSPYGNLV